MLLNLSQYCLAHPTLTLCNSFCWALCAPQPGLCVLHWNQRWFDGVRGTPEAEPCQWLRLTHTCSSVIQVLNRHPCSAVLSNNRVPLNMYVCLLFFYSRNCPGKAIQLRCMGKQFAPGGHKALKWPFHKILAGWKYWKSILKVAFSNIGTCKPTDHLPRTPGWGQPYGVCIYLSVGLLLILLQQSYSQWS